MPEPREESAYGLVMPFVLVASRGGPHGDDAFTSGWRLGEIDTRLLMHAALGTPEYTVTILSDERAQLDLIAMRHAYTLTETVETDGWETITLRAAEGTP